MKSKDTILKEFKDRYKITKSGLSRQWKHIKECHAFYAGDYMAYRDNVTVGVGASRRVKEVQFNRVKPYVNSIVGFMAQHRRKPDYQAKIEDQEEQFVLSEYLNNFSDYVRDNANSDQIETQQDRDMVIGGVGVTDTAITLKSGYATRDPNGEILVERVDPLECGYDPLAVAPNLLDSRWCWRAKNYDLKDAMELFDAQEEDFDFVDTDDAVDYEYNPYGGIQDKIGLEWADPQRTQVRVYFYQWYDIENFYRIENPLYMMSPQDGALMYQALLSVDNEDEEMFRLDPQAQTLIITKQNRAKVKDIFETFGIKFDPISDKRKVFYTAVLSGDTVFQRFKSTSQQGFSMKFKVGDRDEVNKIWTGIVSSMRDPQRYYNKSLTELLLIIASNSRGGVMYEDGAIDDIQKFEASWAKTNAAVKVNAGALSGGKIQPKATPQMSTGYEGVAQASSEAMQQVTGIDESFFGVSGGGNETAMLQRQRIKQATTTLACYFDSIILYTKEQARLMLSFMRLLAESSEGQLFNTFSPQGQIVFERISTDFFVDEYVVSISEAPETPMQKEFFAQTLIGMAQSMQALGDPQYKQIYAMAIKQLPISDRDKSDLIKVLSEGAKYSEEQLQQMLQPLQAQIQQMQSQQAQLQAEKFVADIDKTKADTAKVVEEARKTALEREEVVEDIEKKSIENDIMAIKPIKQVDVTV